MSAETDSCPTQGPAAHHRMIPRPRIVDTWFYKVLAMMFSLMCFTGIVASLMVYDNNPAPGFFYGLTLNGIISLLAAASKSSLIFVIAEFIGQLKWLWFYESD
ncbi:hypothetical protein BJX66DRAFT_332517 [Aspergillus keveii]|uniref:Uncharacterized protein n=1 Tax=Aspergillus keveii TaxID=714993 RepID=A0ABR4GMT4_9EURO